MLRTTLTTALLICAASAAQVAADPAGRHPVIGNISAQKLTNADLLALPFRERQAWVHGAANMAAQTVVGGRPELAGCIISAFTGRGNATEKLYEVMKSFPDRRAAASVFAVASVTCPDFISK